MVQTSTRCAHVNSRGHYGFVVCVAALFNSFIVFHCMLMIEWVFETIIQKEGNGINGCVPIYIKSNWECTPTHSNRRCSAESANSPFMIICTRAGGIVYSFILPQNCIVTVLRYSYNFIIEKHPGTVRRSE